MSNFKSAEKVRAVIDASDTVEYTRSSNRDKINRAVNGFPPLTAEAAKQIGLNVNVNWLEEAVIVKQATLQMFTAFCSQQSYFTIQIPSAPPEQKTSWELALTNGINSLMKSEREFDGLMDDCFASVITHGISPMIWFTEDNWVPEFVALNDFRVPTDTYTSLKNLKWFAIRRRYTVGELAQAVFGKYADDGWNRPQIQKILDEYWDINYEAVDYNWSSSPEKMSELIKQNMIFYTSDAVPTIQLWHFYHLDDSNIRNPKWLMKVVPDVSVRGTDMEQFLFESEDAIAKTLDSFLHIQFGDLSGTAPAMYHSVRSLGFMLHEPCYWLNLTRCRALQYVWENFNMLLRSSDGTDKARAQKVELFNTGWIPEGVTIVPKEQRHQIDVGTLELILSQMKQLAGEASLSYTQQTDTGTSKERTLGEAQIQLQMANALMVGLLGVSSRNIIYLYREICRRFTKKNSLSPAVRKFWQKCKLAGVPNAFLNPNLWEIHPTTPLGNGNQTLQIAQAMQLMSVRPLHSPDAQQEILNMFDAAITQNPRLAARLAPVGGKTTPSDGQKWASMMFGTLMQGVPVPANTELNPIDQISTLLGMVSGVIHRIEQADNVGTPEEVAGISSVFQMVSQLIQWLAQDKDQKELVKKFGDDLGQLANIVKGFAQRQLAAQGGAKESVAINYKDAPDDIKRQMEQKAGFQPSVQPQTDPKIEKAASSIAISEQKHQQKQAHADAAFLAEQHRKSLETKSDIEHEAMKAGVRAALDNNGQLQTPYE